MRNPSKDLSSYISSIVDTITKDDPVRKRWFPEYLKMKYVDRLSAETLEGFCFRMERDRKIDYIINI
jgi:hypothetical protein